MPVTHAFVNPHPDGPDATVTRPSDWNAPHVINIVDADVDPAAAIAESKLNLNFPTHAAVTLGAPANGLSLVGQQLSIGLASGAATGALSAADWTTFNNKQSALTFPLAANLGGTGIANAVGSTLTLGGATTISTGGTIALGGFTLTVPATGTAALLAVANVFTTQQMVDGTSDQIQMRVQAHSTQTANIMTWENSAGTVVGCVDSRGIPNWNLGTDVTNTFIGATAGKAGASDRGNVAIGYGTLGLLTSGKENMCLGAYAGYTITTGNYNTYIGSNAGRYATGNAGLGLGYQALGGNASGLSGNYNIALGYQAGFSLNGSATRNIFIGGQAGYRQTTGSYLLIIDAAVRASIAEEQNNSFLYGSMTTAGYLQVNIPATTNNAVVDVLKLQSYISTASTGSANGFGTGISLQAETATDGTYQQMARIVAAWVDATNATRKAKLSLSAYDTAERLGIEIEASGTAPMLGFFGQAAAAQPAGIADADGTLADITTKFNTLIGALETLGLIATV